MGDTLVRGEEERSVVKCEMRTVKCGSVRRGALPLVIYEISAQNRHFYGNFLYLNGIDREDVI